MHFAALAFSLLSTALVVGASAFTNPNAPRQPQACNKDYSYEACGACHYFRQCLDERTKAWITPCKSCDHTSWCNCTAPPDLLDPPQDSPKKFRF
ncbi:hypothetical protein DIS24_g5597 [Lasiodiplodia hormozganensis]|uniref:Uncharacterized protein n=1 Tax=Lasiodiplodia hormozganensis TaxID=869390 RepID=A0AA39YLP9_9PEZI|nr:hypothetical protein DIS24_g5597 [Lasiodiplodia hormozganensis]